MVIRSVLAGGRVKLPDAVYKFATGPERRRKLLAPFWAAGFFAVIVAVFAGGMLTDRILGLPRLLDGLAGVGIGIVLVGAGMVVYAWCVAVFLRAKGTPVPVNPPRELVQGGPYAVVRNPMLTGLFAVLFGLGFILHSMSTVLVWMPLFILLNAIWLRLVEEPELEKRLGVKYAEYRQRVPMFIPKWHRRSSAA